MGRAPYPEDVGRRAELAGGTDIGTDRGKAWLVAEVALLDLVKIKSCLKFVFVKIRPKAFAEIKFGVSCLPSKKIT